jgi:uncharacterized protein
MSDRAWEAKKAALAARLARLDGVLVAFSGGVDSSVLLHAAHAALGERAAALIADSPSLPRRELEEAIAVARSIGARLEIVATDEMGDERYRANAGDRCYWCKSALFDAMRARARELGVEALAFGEITDDQLDHRPGARAARERGVIAPLAESAFSKDDVRRYAREAALAVSEKPSSACLASRIPVGTRVSADRLARIEAAEESLRSLGVRQLRVRDHGEHARVEVGADEIDRARAQREIFSEQLARHGFTSVEIDVYRAPSERIAR